MNLFEVIRWGNESDDPYMGGPNGPDTCFLVRADTPEAAAALADAVLAGMPSEFVQGWSHAIHLLGADAGTDRVPRVLRGPYIQHAFTHGWRLWGRDAPGEPWVERQPAEQRHA